MTVEPGFELPAWEVPSVSAESMKLYAALARDPTPIHWDPAAAAERGMGDKVINQGPTSLGYVINMLQAWAGPEGLRMVDARFTDNVFAGDRVVARGTVTAVREADGETVADVDAWLERDGDRVVVASATVVVP